jgi:uncharacterized alkaline shock family protein YloU
MREIATADGRLVITEPAVAAVAAAAALGCPGVAALGGRRLQDEFTDWLLEPTEHPARSRRPGAAGVDVELDAVRCAIALEVIVAYGARISDVCGSVAGAVSSAVEAGCGFAPQAVDVRAVGVRRVPAPPQRGDG